ncbi:MAG: endonuclease domain-containing protein [Acidimicrobiales bacterium]
MTHAPAPADRFCYDGYEIDPGLGRLTCRYSVGQRGFTEHVTFGPEGDWGGPATRAAARLVFLLLGVSYYKTSAPPVVDLGDTATTAAERAFLRTFYVEGLGEFAYRNGLDLTGLAVEGPDGGPDPMVVYNPATTRPLIPFGGGIDSIVTVEAVRRRFPASALFIVDTWSDRFSAIERPAAVTGLPIIRAERSLDPQVLRPPGELGFLNGHVPVTGIISAIAVMAAVLGRRDTVVMSNEWSASVGNLVIDGRAVNHQWSKSLEFETRFRSVLGSTFGGGLQYFSYLRPHTELWVAQRFATLTGYHPWFRSCNRAFHIDPAQRLDHWCGRCDKCCFIDLILAPFLSPPELAAIFGGREPLAERSLEDRFRALLGNWPEVKPFECVGDEEECRAAVLVAAARPDRSDNAILGTLAAELRRAGAGEVQVDELLAPVGEHCIPDAYAPDDQLV